MRGRVGFALDRILVYGTAGWAWARIKNKSIGTDAGAFDPADSVKASQTRPVIVWGGGGENAFTNNWIGQIEAMHVDFGDQSLTTPNDDVFRFNNEATVGRLGLSIKF